MDLEKLLQRDPNALPYRMIEVRTERFVEVRFMPLLPVDVDELRGTEWRTAHYADVWEAYAQVGNTLKLVRSRSRDRRIQGLVHLGHVDFPGDSLTGSLLEAAPFNQYDRGKTRAYREAGKQLVVRLVVESYQRGGQGKVLVQARLGSERFYEALGFRRVSRGGHRFLLGEAAAAGLVRQALLVEPKGFVSRVRNWFYQHFGGR